jgi:argininosuccinate lyase
MMPQKKNPDALELVRAKAALAQGWTTAMLGLLKALPLGYNRDLQETKPLLFEAAATAQACLSVCTLAASSFTFQTQRALEAASDPTLLATDLAEYLVAKGMPFRDAHTTVARIMRDRPSVLSLETLRAASPLFEADVLEMLNPVVSARRRQK